MKSIVFIISALALFYLLGVAFLYFLQRNLLFYPVPVVDGIAQETISFNNDAISLHGWVLNQGKQKALVYFGGNAEDITDNILLFEELFENYTVYLINYRGYGKSQGTPSEAALFSDAIAIYDQIMDRHDSISLMGRSLGSGVAVYLASKRDIDQLFLLTPYDSIAEVAKTHYPYFPISYLIKDRFESIAYAAQLKASILILAAEFDRVVPVKHAERLRDRLTRSKVSYHLIAGAEHNNITAFPRYREIIRAFINRAE
ncbi:MAG: alpha/beta hydrolase [Gammaproteobacteria bacterium]|nr:alpha/beta hydrolase [Gammaproteobacteria bacterium]